MSARTEAPAMKGVLLAGGTGSRLWPATHAVSKQLLPVYDKPLIYYPLSALMLAGLREILVITQPREQELFQRLLGDGSQWGLEISYATQAEPTGIPEAFTIARDFLNGAGCTLVLGDNIFFGGGLTPTLTRMTGRARGGSILTYWVADPERYGVVDLDQAGCVRGIVEKPVNPPSNWAITGFYAFDGRVPDVAAELRPSARGETEIVDVMDWYRRRGELHVECLGRGVAWLDTGTHQSLLEAGSFVHTIEARQGMKVCCVEEIAWRKGYIDDEQLSRLAARLEKSGYGAYLSGLLRREGGQPTDPTPASVTEPAPDPAMADASMDGAS